MLAAALQNDVIITGGKRRAPSTQIWQRARPGVVLCAPGLTAAKIRDPTGAQAVCGLIKSASRAKEPTFPDLVDPGPLPRPLKYSDATCSRLRAVF